MSNAAPTTTRQKLRWVENESDWLGRPVVRERFENDAELRARTAAEAQLAEARRTARAANLLSNIVSMSHAEALRLSQTLPDDTSEASLAAWVDSIATLRSRRDAAGQLSAALTHRAEQLEQASRQGGVA